MGTHRRRRNRPPRCGLHTMGHQGQIRSTQLRESREPRAESREPRAESREPRAESREPRAESREPRAESREPRAESREPRAESREPRAESREPRAESREPRAESREPRAESREPRAESRYQPPRRRHASAEPMQVAPTDAEFSPPLAGDPPCADESRAAHLPAASGEPSAGRPPGAPVPLARTRGPKPRVAEACREVEEHRAAAFLTRLGVLLGISTAVARRHRGGDTLSRAWPTHGLRRLTAFAAGGCGGFARRGVAGQPGHAGGGRGRAAGLSRSGGAPGVLFMFAGGFACHGQDGGAAGCRLTDVFWRAPSGAPVSDDAPRRRRPGL